jgi:hypothetical protein
MQNFGRETSTEHSEDPDVNGTIKIEWIL